MTVPLSPTMLTMAALDAMSPAEFVATLGDLFEHSPWVMEAIVGARPFGSARRLHDAAMASVSAASDDAQLTLLRAHPELAGREASAGTLTADSSSEQDRLGLTRLAAADHAELTAMNAAYHARFGFPAIVALRRHASRDTVFAAIRARLDATPDAERAIALAEVGYVTEGRLTARLGRTGSGFTLQAIDTVRGGGAPDLGFTLLRCEAGTWRVLAEGQTNASGRTAAPALSPLDMEPGQYRIDYRVGDYHRRTGDVAPGALPFLDVVPIAFGIADASAHHHVVLQFTPWAYATHRGN